MNDADRVIDYADTDRRNANPTRWQAAQHALLPLFAGNTYNSEHDEVRLRGQLCAVYLLMKDAQWRSLREIHEAIGRGSEAAISARLRDLRKERHGRNVVERRRRGDPGDGIHEYRLVVNQTRRFEVESAAVSV